MSLLFFRAHTGVGVLYYESHEALRLHCLSLKAPGIAEHHGTCSSGEVFTALGAGADTTCVGGDRSRRQRQVAMGVGWNRKEFSDSYSKGRNSRRIFISCSSSLLLGSRTP